MLSERIIFLRKDVERLQRDDGRCSELNGQRIHCGSHQDLAAFKRGAEFVVEPGYRFHVRPNHGPVAASCTLLVANISNHLLLLPTDVRAAGRRARGRPVPFRLQLSTLNSAPNRFFFSALQVTALRSRSHSVGSLRPDGPHGQQNQE